MSRSRLLEGALLVGLFSLSAPASGQSVSFEDEAGRDAAVYLEGSRAYVRVEDSAANVGSDSIETVVATLTSSLAGDLEIVELEETGADTGVFAGSIDLRLVTPPAGVPGVLETAAEYGPPARRDTIQVAYQGGAATDSASLAGSEIRLLDEWGWDTESYVPGEQIFLQVRSNLSDDWTPPRRAAVEVETGSDLEGFLLLETGDGTGVFTGWIASRAGSSSPFDGVIGLLPGEVVTAIRRDPDVGTESRDGAEAAAARIDLVDTGGRPVVAYIEGERVEVRLRTSSGDPWTVDASWVDVTAGLSGDQEGLQLRETGPETGILTGSLATRRAGASQGDGILQLGRLAGSPPTFDTATVTESASGASRTAGFTGSRIRFLDAYGGDAQVYATGSAVHVRVEDHNADDPASQDAISVSLRSLATGDAETVLLTETARRSGIFEGSLPLADSAVALPSDGELQARPDEEVEARRTGDLGDVAWDRAAVAATAVEIVDEGGRPAAEVLEDGTLRVRVFSLADAVDPSSPDTVTVILRSRLAGDEESLALTETGPDTRVFEGGVSLSAAPAAPGNGALETAGSLERDEEVTASYGAASDTVQTVLIRLQLVDGAGRSTAVHPLGEPIRIRAERRRGSNPESPDTISVEAWIPPHGDREWDIRLEETGRDTNVFEGMLPTAEGEGPRDDGVLQGWAGQTFEVWVNALAGARFVRQAVLAWSSVELVDDQGRPAPFYLESSRAHLRVVDHFADPDPGSAGTVQATLSAELTGDAETVTLVETGPATGVFTGSIPLRLAPASAGNGILEIMESSAPPHFDRITAEYAGPSGVSSDAADLRGSLTWWIDAQGSPAASYASGSVAHVRVEDRNADRLSTVRERVEVTLRSLVTGDEETLEILETGRATGIFEGPVPLRHAGGLAPGDGYLEAGVGEEIEAEHPDYLGNSVSRATAVVAEASLSFIDGEGGPTAHLLLGETARLRVFAFERNVDPGAAETVEVTVRSTRGADEETVTLAETGSDTATFEGGIPLRYGTGTSGNGVLEADLDDYRPEDEVTAAFASLSAAARVAVRRVVFIDAWGREAESFALGGRIHLRVVEPSANGAASYTEEIDAGVYVPGGDREGVLLEETHRDSGVFEGSIESAAGARSDYDGVLQGTVGDAIEGFRENPPVARARLAGSVVDFVDSGGRPAFFYFESSRAFVRVVNAMANDPSRVDIVTADISTEGTLDRETLVLTETGADTGIFEGSIGLRTGSAQLEDSELQTAGSPQEPDSLVATYGGAPARIDLRRSRTAFLDEWGREAVSYPVGATVRVRVEDHNAAREEPASPVRVVLRSLSTADEEVLELNQAGETSFEGALPLAHSGSPAPGDGLLQALPGEEIAATHENPPGFAASGARARVEGEALAFVDEAGAPVSEVLERGTARLRAVSLLDNLDPAAAESVTATVRSLYASDLETVTLAETGPDTGVFTGLLPLGLASAVHGNGLLETGRGGPSGREWDRLTAVFRGAEAVAETRRSRLAWIDAFGADAESFAVGERAYLRMVSPRSDTYPELTESVTVYVRSLANQDYEYVDLQETGPGTGVFEGSVGTADEAEPFAPGVVPIAVGATLSVEHLDHPDLDASTDEAMMAANSVRLLDPRGRPSPTFPRGFRVAVRVVDIYTDADEGSPGSAEVALVSDLTGDEETLLLTETGAATAVFEGTILLRPGLAQPGDGTLDTGEQPGEPEVHDTIRATRSTARGTSMASATVVPVDQQPVAADDSAETAEDTAVGIPVLANDDDAEGSLLQVAAVTQGAHGAVAVQSDQTVIYTPQPDFHGTDTFSYTVSDGQGGSATAMVSVVVTPVNDPPAAVDDSVEIDEESTAIVPILANDSDAEGGSLTVPYVVQGENGRAVLQEDQTVLYEPFPDYFGSAWFAYVVSDDQGEQGFATVTVTVRNVNEPPQAVDDLLVAEEDGTGTADLVANDWEIDGGTLTVSSVTQGAHGSVTILESGREVRYQPVPDFYGDDSFTYTMTDGQGGSDTGTVDVFVEGVNDSPVAVDDNVEVAEDGSASFAVLANDVDLDGPRDIHRVEEVTPAQHGEVMLQEDMTVRYVPKPDYHGSDSFTYTISDWSEETDPATVFVTVTPVNDAPTAADDSAVTAEDAAVTVTVLGNDSDLDGDTLRVTAVTQGAHGTVRIQDVPASVRYEPVADYHGSDSFTYTASDGQGGSATASVAVTVTPVNDPPAAADDSARLIEDGSAVVAVLSNDTDVDGDPVTLTGVTRQALHGTVTVQEDQTVRYEPAADYHGPDSFTYSTSDGRGGTGTATVSLTVTPVNDPPVPVGDSVQMAEDTAAAVAVLSNDTDVDGDSLFVSAVTQGAHGTVTLQGDLMTVLYRPAPDFHGSDGFTYTVSDGQGGSATATVAVTVTPVNDPPVAVDDSAVTVENQFVDIDVLANDSDVDGLALEILSTTAPAHGTMAFTSDRGFVRYIPDPGYAGSDSFEYTVRDGAGGEDTAVVRVTVRVPRVGSGIQAFYDFEEGGGATVRDRSGVGAPLDLTVADPSAVHWGSGSLVLDAPTIVQSGASAAKVTDACVASDALTLEAWVTPGNLVQNGRWILTLSGGEAERNFTLGQGTGLSYGDLFEGRVRATLTTQNGLPALSSSAVAARGALVHVVYTRTSGGTARIYVDNQMRGELVVGGTFDGWSSAYRLALGAEIGGGRAWLGELHLVAVYCRALTESEVRQNFRAGPSGY